MKKVVIVVAIILVVALLVGVLAAFSSGFKNWDTSTWFEKKAEYKALFPEQFVVDGKLLSASEEPVWGLREFPKIFQLIDGEYYSLYLTSTNYTDVNFEYGNYRMALVYTDAFCKAMSIPNDKFVAVDSSGGYKLSNLIKDFAFDYYPALRDYCNSAVGQKEGVFKQVFTFKMNGEIKTFDCLYIAKNLPDVYPY